MAEQFIPAPGPSRGEFDAVNNNLVNLAQADGTNKNPGNINLNDLKTSGRYYVGSGATNIPVSGTGGYVEVYTANANNTRQVFLPYNSDAIYCRKFVNGTWGDWIDQIANMGNCDLLISTQSGSFNNIALPTGKAFSDYRLLYIEPVTANEAPTDNWMIPVAVFKLHNSNAALMIMNFLNDAYSIRFKYSSDTTAACDIRYNGAAQTTYTVKIYGVK